MLKFFKSNSVKNHDKRVYNALGCTIPQMGEEYHCLRIEQVQGERRFVKATTTPVKELEYLGGNTHQITTANSIYVVNVTGI